MVESLSERYLAVRPEDHVILGVQWWGAEPDAITGPTAVRVSADGGGLLVTFPPQHLGEGAFPPGVPISLGSGILAGLSQLAVDLDPDTVVVLDVPGVLAAMAAGRVHGRRFSSGADATLVEVPYGLHFTPVSAAGGDVTCLHPIAPAAGPSTTVGLWRTRLRGAQADRHANLGGRGDDVRYAGPEVLRRDPEPTSLPLDAAKRQQIVDAIAGSPALVSRLELSALGGSLVASASTEDLDWSHSIALGRDQRVRFVEHGILYPFGHRALYIESTEREFDIDETAALRTHRSLIVTEPSKSVVIDDPVLNRMFPFDDVEITTPVFSKLGPPLHHHFTRPPPDIAAEANERDQKQADRNARFASIEPILTRRRSVEELGTPEAQQYLENIVARAEADQELADAAEITAARDRILDDIGRVQKLLDAASDEQEIADLNAQLTGLSLDLEQHPPVAPGVVAAATRSRNDAQAEIVRLQPTIDEQCDRDLSVAELAAGNPDDPGVQTANDILVLDERIAALDRVIAANPSKAIDREWIIGPTVLPAPPLPPSTSAESLAPLVFPLRCSTRTSAQADVHMNVPLAFIVEFHLDVDDDFPAFDSLVDGQGGQSLQQILDEFCASRTPTGVMSLVGFDDPPRPDDRSAVRGIGVDLPAVNIDVIHGAATAAGDRLEVHALTLVGLPHGRAFVPRVAQYQAVMPAVRGLFGDAQDTVRSIGYRDQFLTRGQAEDVALELLDGALGIDFSTQADRSGALLAPVIEASGISRRNGPVSVNGVLTAATGRLDPLQVLGDGATLLGFDLRTLIGELPAPPQIVQDIVAGSPLIRVKWGGMTPPDGPIVLRSVGPFDAEPRPGVRATVTLSAEITRAGISTECAVRDFALCFPSPDDPLLRLSFASVVFKQAVGEGADLSVHGVDVDFLGDLRLLDELQNKVGLGSNVPKVRVGVSGIGVGYAFEVPDADCGEFTLRNIAVRAALDVPFQPTDQLPIVLSLGFASRAKPFNLSVMALGGGGYIDVQLDKGGVRHLELSLEFGATIALNLGIVSAEVHALAGVRAELGPGEHVSITGYVRIGGTVELLGLITVTIELVVSLRYDPPPVNALFGKATVVVEIDLTLYSDSIELDSGDWRLVGGDALGLDRGAGRPRPDLTEGLEAWRRYRRSFAEEVAQ